MSLSAAASRRRKSPRRGAVRARARLQQRAQTVPAVGGEPRAAVECFAEAVRLTAGRDKVYCFALGQACLAVRDLPSAIDAFRMAARAAPDWFAPKQALEMLGASLDEGKSSAALHDDDDDVDMPPARK